MKGFTIYRRVAAPADRVFSILTDFEGAPTRIAAIEKVEILTEGPIGIGTRLRETRVVHSRRATEEMQITRFEPGGGYVVSCESHGCVFTTGFILFPDGDGTKLEAAFECEPRTFLARLMVGLMMRAVKKEFERDIDALKAAAEAVD